MGDALSGIGDEAFGSRLEEPNIFPASLTPGGVATGRQDALKVVSPIDFLFAHLFPFPLNKNLFCCPRRLTMPSLSFAPMTVPADQRNHRIDRGQWPCHHPKHQQSERMEPLQDVLPGGVGSFLAEQLGYGIRRKPTQQPDSAIDGEVEHDSISP